MNQMSSALFNDSKRHYIILDGLRGVAAVMVVMFHVMETFTGGSNLKQIINHGYLAVDFFFVLSGFVIGYAYDDRWGKMSIGSFFKRRLIRLHPMIIAGMIIGAITFYFQVSKAFPAISETPVWKMLLVMFIGFTLLPVPLSMDIRGWTEMHPLDGPAWSLFFEYIANILYALFVRKFSNTLLAVLVFIAGCFLIHFAVFGPQGDVIGGWSLEPAQLRIGFIRLLYPFFAGLLLSRMVKPGSIQYAFFWCSLLLIISFSIPRMGGAEHLWMNGLYVAFCILFVFPFIVYLGASGEVKGTFALKMSKFLGDISYPIYIIHYPFIYMFTAWVENTHPSMSKALPVGLIVLIASIAIAYLSVRLYDEPVRKWLMQRFIPATKK